MDQLSVNTGPVKLLCKWCQVANGEVIFENACLCSACHEKALAAVANPRLCNTCAELGTDEDVYRQMFSEYGSTHKSINALIDSCDEGCALCRLFLLQDPNPDPTRLQVPLSLRAERDASTSDTGKDINLMEFSSEPDMYRLKLAVSAAPDDAAASYVTQRPVEETLGSDGTIEKIREWLKECLATHDESPHSHQVGSSQRCSPLPTRVVDVGTGTHPVVKLFQPASTVYAEYTCLSYCWGRDRFLTTLSSNIQTHLQGLEESILPQTFKDAIEITRKIGFRYLWIDALCIIQDSSEDKAKEINAMESIYSNATLTFAIVGAKKVVDGFLHTKARLKTEIPYQCPDGRLGSIQISPQETVDLWQQPLYTRAWCLQENLLPSRLLSFTDTEVVWQCKTTPVRRPNTTHVEYLYDNPSIGLSPFSRLPETISLEPQQSPNDLEYERYTTWRDIVENYTRRSITVPSDRLPAIAGIAKRLQDAWGDEYLAGVWKRHFIASLTWRRTVNWQDPEEKRFTYFAPLEKYRAPSWSWASVEGPVEFDYRLDQGNIKGLGAKLISCQVVPLREASPLGEIQSAEAVLEASLIPAGDVPLRDARNPDSYRQGGTVKVDNFEEKNWLGPNFGHKLDDDTLQNGWCMLLGEGRDGTKKMTSATALILMPVEGRDLTFRRVAFWRSSCKGLSGLWAGASKRKIVTLI